MMILGVFILYDLRANANPDKTPLLYLSVAHNLEHSPGSRGFAPGGVDFSKENVAPSRGKSRVLTAVYMKALMAGYISLSLP